MEIILVRHTTPNIKKGICYGQADIEVASTFEKEIQPILKEVPLNDANISYYSSPLKRCAVLANELSERINFDNRLKELDFGDWELQNWNAISKEELTVWMDDFVTIPAKNGESYLDLHKRTTAFLTDLQKNATQKAIIITHAGVIRSIWAYANKIPLKNSFELKLDYGAVIKLNL